MTNDQYFAMPYGPVASGSKDIAAASDFLSEEERTYAGQFLKPDGHFYRSLHDVDEDELSESDLEALEFAWNNYGQSEGFRLSEWTHSFPEWSRHEAALQSSHTSRVPMAYSDFLSDPDPDIDPMPPLTDADRETRVQHLSSLREIESIWS